MSASTRSPRTSASLTAWAFVVALLAGAPEQAHAREAPPLPREVLAVAPKLAVQGGGRLTFLGIAVYDGWYWTATGGWPESGVYALDLVYHRDLSGTRIAQRSVEEIAQLGYGTASQHTRWGMLMTRIFPDVREGDRLTGLHTADGSVRYFHNGQPIGSIDDPGFARAFFGIWLDPRTSRPDFRQQLLGRP